MSIIKVVQDSSKLIRSTFYDDSSDEDHYIQPSSLTTSEFVPLTVFDRLAEDEHSCTLYAYRQPNPSNILLEQGLRKALSEYPEWAGRFGIDDGGRRVILLSNEGMRLIEASTNCTLDEAMPFKKSTLLSFNPSYQGIEELALVQLTRFTCGSLVLSFSSNHMVADGVLMSRFMVAWGQACRGIDIHPCPSRDRNIFSPRVPSCVKFHHMTAEITKRDIIQDFVKPPYSGDDVIQHKVHFSPEFLAKLKSNASSLVLGIVNGKQRPYSTFVSLAAHLWRTITKVRGLAKFQKTEMRISVNGRRRMKPHVPDEFFGNLVLWANPEAQAKDILDEPLSGTAEIIHDAVAKVNDDYFKSYIDFANYEIQQEDLIPKENWSVPSWWPNLEVDCWLGFPLGDIDFGVGKPCIIMPPFHNWEGVIYLLPSYGGDEGIDVYLSLFQQQLDLFEKLCYSID
ncbi:hypothetical protein C5167_016320 [Papaver somniferum]|uniref:agmatine coumaroyltransferase-2-like n=1 Tax=Papaver somniferum TaxID=3469 RepID=UPI000E700F28|nr:agmatine coumaroyltransferase-2-like [Papaver somniferum]RZC93691.1 hypothetical protein C5167_016320 [Papaver somniferum]